MTRTYYDLLGVSDDATTEAIESAYRDAIRDVHPDVNDEADASERAARLNKAKEVLTDPDERARYDRQSHESYTSGTADSPGSGAGRTGHTGDDGPDSSTDRERGDTSPGRSRSAQDTTAGSDAGNRTRETAAAGNRTREAAAAGNRTRETAAAGNRTREAAAAGNRTREAADAGRTRTTVGSHQSPSARRQAAASATPGPNVEGSWNDWDVTGSWAVHRDADDRRNFYPARLPTSEMSLLTTVVTFLLYPVFVFSATAPLFPLPVRLVVAVCTLLTIVYLLSVPEVAIMVFGLWSLVVTFGLLLVPGLSVFSVFGIVSLLSMWIPLGFALLTLSVLRFP